MPPIRYFTVEETRKVKVRASTPYEASTVAQEAFSLGTPVQHEIGRTTTEVEVCDVTVREDF